jgi:hypothetical protein
MKTIISLLRMYVCRYTGIFKTHWFSRQIHWNQGRERFTLPNLTSFRWVACLVFCASLAATTASFPVFKSRSLVRSHHMPYGENLRTPLLVFSDPMRTYNAYLHYHAWILLPKLAWHSRLWCTYLPDGHGARQSLNRPEEFIGTVILILVEFLWLESFLINQLFEAINPISFVRDILIS